MSSAGIRNRDWTSSGPSLDSDIGHVSSGHYPGLGVLFPVLEQLFVILLLLSSMNVVSAFTPSSRNQIALKVASADVDTFSVVVDACLYIFGGVLALMHWRQVLRGARTAWPLLAIAGLACLSTIWSVEPMITLRRSVGLMAATTLGIYVGARYSIQDFARLLARTFCLMMMLIIVLYLAAPAYVIDSAAYGGAWKGLSGYKNTFGAYMAVGFLLLVLVRFQRFCWLRYVFLVIAGGLLVLSRSATAVVCGILGLAALPLWRLIRGKKPLLAYLLVAVLFFAGIYCLLAFPEALFKILGRDATLTGRTRLWAMLLPVIANRPILGYGYAAFWAGLRPEVLSVWLGTGRRLVPIADNGYIDLGLSLGALGLCAVLWILWRSFRDAIDYLRSTPGSISLWPITYLFIFAADNICESGLLTRGTFPYLVFAILTTSLAVSRKRVVTPAPADHWPVMQEWSPPLRKQPF